MSDAGNTLNFNNEPNISCNVNSELNNTENKLNKQEQVSK